MRTFNIVAAALAAIVLGMRLWAASHEWFIADDYYFLHYLQSDAWSWGEVFMPSQPRMIAVYRPLGLETYYFANFQLFGFRAFGYYAVGLLIHAGTAAVVYRIARQLAFDHRVAIGAALLVLASSPGFTATYMVAVHNYLLAGLFYALSVSWFLRHLRERKPRLQLLSCAALALGLLCNDFCATLPIVVLAATLREHGIGFKRAALLQCVRAVWPQALVTALFLDFRINGVPVPLHQEGWFYEIDFGPDMLWNTGGNLAHVAGGAWQLALLLLALASSAVWIVRGESALPAAWRVQVRRNLAFSLVWLGAVLFPFAVLAFPNPRFALAVQAPFVLTLGALLDGLFTLRRAQRWLPYALLLLVVAAVPWSAALEHVQHPDAAPHAASFALAQKLLAAKDSPVEKVEICYGGAGLANDAALERFRWETFGGSVVRAAAPQWPIEVTFRKRDGGGDPALCEHCRRFYLLPNLQLTLMQPTPRA